MISRRSRRWISIATGVAIGYISFLRSGDTFFMFFLGIMITVNMNLLMGIIFERDEDEDIYS